MRLGLALSVAALALVGATSPERPAIAAAPAAAPAASWAGFRDGFIEGWFKIDPAGDRTHNQLAGFFGDHVLQARMHDLRVAGLTEHTGEPFQFIPQETHRLGVV